MSFLRKTVLTTAVIGAGLVSTAGAAFACDNPGGDEHHGHHGSHSSTTIDSNNDSSCSNGVGTGDKTGNGLIGVGNVLDAPITANVCHVLENNGNGNGTGNTLNVGGGLGGVPDLGGLLGGGASAAPSAQTFQAAPAQAAPVQQAAPAQAAPVQQAAPAQASAVPAGTSTTPIQG